MTDDPVQILIEHHNPQEETSLFILDSGGAYLLNYVEDLADEEQRAYQDQVLDFKVLSAGSLLYLCHSLPGRSWNDAEINIFDNREEFEALLSEQPEQLSFDYLLIDLNRNTLLHRERLSLDTKDTKTIIAGLKAQRSVGITAINDLRVLGEPSELIHALSRPGLPKVEDIAVNKEKRTVTIKANFDVPRERNEPRARWIMRRTEKMPNNNLLAYKLRVESLAAGKITPYWKYCLLPTSEVRFYETQSTRIKLTGQLEDLGVVGGVEDYVDELESTFDLDYSSTYTTLIFNWRQSQGVYVFDEELLKSLYLTNLPTQLPPSILTRLPEYCVYVETPGGMTWNGEPMLGFFAMAEEILDDDDGDAKRGAPYLLLDVGAPENLEKTYLLTFSLDETTIKDSLQTLTEIDSKRKLRPELREWLTPYLLQLFYLCSEEPELDRRSGPNSSPIKAEVKPTRKGNKLFPPAGTTIWDCGWRTGEFIRRARDKKREEAAENNADDEGRPRKSPRGHIRRAHFHTWYAGPRSAPEREVRIKWLSMIRVNIKPDELEMMPVVVKRVR